MDLDPRGVVGDLGVSHGHGGRISDLDAEAVAVDEEVAEGDADRAPDIDAGFVLIRDAADVEALQADIADAAELDRTTDAGSLARFGDDGQTGPIDEEGPVVTSTDPDRRARCGTSMAAWIDAKGPSGLPSAASSPAPDTWIVRGPSVVALGGAGMGVHCPDPASVAV
jgi:hypothetical protein